MRKTNSIARSREGQPASRPLHVPGWIATGAYVFVPIATAGLLVIHTVELGDTRVDTTTLGLLALLLFVPLAPYIRRLSAGGVEAEIGPREAQRLQASAAELPAAPETVDETPLEEPTIQELIARDPPLGLAKLRIELENELRRLSAVHISGASRVGLPLGLLARELREQDVLPSEIAAPLADVIALANRAIHGEYVPAEVASDIADVGVRVLGALRQIE